MRPALLALLIALPGSALAQDRVVNRQQVWSQVVFYPSAFGTAPAFQDQTPEGFFITEFVPGGQSVESWQQMQTLTGHRGLVTSTDPAQAAAGAERMALGFLQGYQQACALPVEARSFPAPVLPGARASFSAYLGCAEVRGEGRSEEMVFVIVIGSADVYTLQWAERGPARPSLAGGDGARWGPRLATLEGARLCTPAPGEAAPYPSCN